MPFQFLLPTLYLYMGFCCLDPTSLKTATSLIQKRKEKIKNLETGATEPWGRATVKHRPLEITTLRDHSAVVLSFTFGCFTHR